MIKQKHFFLIRGLIRESAHWGQFIPKLQSLYPQAKITTPDIPGAGIYYQEKTPLNLSQVVKKMRERIKDQINPDEEKIVIAISLGGMVTLEWYRQFPEDFNKLILINTSYGQYSSMFQRLRPSALKHILKVPFLKGEEKESWIQKLVYNFSDKRELNLPNWVSIQSQRPVSIENSLRQIIAAARFKGKDIRPQIPTLVMVSLKDRMVSPLCSETIAKAWNVPIKRHPDAGHDLSGDDPDWILQETKDFI